MKYWIAVLTLLLTGLVILSLAVGNFGSTRDSSSISEEERQTERIALESIYQGSNGTEWLLNAGWLSIAPHCDWYGISCDSAGYVNGISLDENNLVGAIPESINNLAHLTSLELQGNQLEPLPILDNPQLNPVICKTNIISPPENTASISTNSVFTTADGQVIYLAIRGDGNGYGYDLFHVSGDNVVTNLGVITVIDRAFRVPVWHIDMDSNSVFYESMTSVNDNYQWSLERIDLVTGNHEKILPDIWDMGFGTIDGFVWVNRDSNEADPPDEVVLVDMATREQISFRSNFSDYTFFAPRNILSPTEAILSLSASNDQGSRYIRANSQTTSSYLLHDDIADESLVLDNRIVYINTEGIFKEIDFQGQVLREILLPEANSYDDLTETAHGFLYDSDAGIYFIPNSGEAIQLTSERLLHVGDSPDIQVITEPNGQELVWFAASQNGHSEQGRLYAFRLAQADAPVAQKVLEIASVDDFELSPNRNFVIAEQGRLGLIISTETLEQVTSINSYYGYMGFSNAEDQIFFRADNGIYAYNFEQVTRQVLAMGQNYQRFQIDQDDELIYFSASAGNIEPFYAVTFDADPAVEASYPDVYLAPTTHTWSFQITHSGDLLYVDQTWQTLYRAQCHRND